MLQPQLLQPLSLQLKNVQGQEAFTGVLVYRRPLLRRQEASFLTGKCAGVPCTGSLCTLSRCAGKKPFFCFYVELFALA